MELEIRNADLIPSVVPETAADSEGLETFALSFDGYAHWGNRCGPLAEAAAAAFHAERTLPDDLSDLRACLFYEHQRWRWQPDAAGDAGRAYLQALLDAIRAATAGAS